MQIVKFFVFSGLNFFRRESSHCTTNIMEYSVIINSLISHGVAHDTHIEMQAEIIRGDDNVRGQLRKCTYIAPIVTFYSWSQHVNVESPYHSITINYYSV